VSTNVGFSPKYVGRPDGFLAMTQHFVVVGKVMTRAEVLQAQILCDWRVFVKLKMVGVYWG
jgi:hypothetical protein